MRSAPLKGADRGVGGRSCPIEEEFLHFVQAAVQRHRQAAAAVAAWRQTAEATPRRPAGPRASSPARRFPRSRWTRPGSTSWPGVGTGLGAVGRVSHRCNRWNWSRSSSRCTEHRARLYRSQTTGEVIAAPLPQEVTAGRAGRAAAVGAAGLPEGGLPHVVHVDPDVPGRRAWPQAFYGAIGQDHPEVQRRSGPRRMRNCRRSCPDKR